MAAPSNTFLSTAAIGNREDLSDIIYRITPTVTPLLSMAAKAKAIIVPEFNRVGWLAKEIKTVIDDPRKVVGAPRVFGGMTMPPELIIDEIRRAGK